MKTFSKVAAATVIGIFAATTLLHADPVKGQKIYLKTLKAKFHMNGTKFAAEHTADEWEELFDDNAAGFIEEYSERFPKAERFLKNPKNLKKLRDVGDFAREYGSDTGNVPSCG